MKSNFGYKHEISPCLTQAFRSMHPHSLRLGFFIWLVAGHGFELLNLVPASETAVDWLLLLLESLTRRKKGYERTSEPLGMGDGLMSERHTIAFCNFWVMSMTFCGLSVIWHECMLRAQVCFFLTCNTMTRSRLMKRELLHAARTLQMKGSCLGNKSGMDFSERNRGEIFASDIIQTEGLR